MKPRIRIPIQEFIRRILWSLSPEKARQDMFMKAVKTYIMLGFRLDVHSLHDSYV